MKKINWIAYLLCLTGLIGFIFSFIITVEKIAVLNDANYVPPCSINPLISCGTVMKSPQSAIFGFPNPLLGIAGFAIVTTIGFALLAGANFRRWFWVCTQIGVFLAATFIYWLFYQSVFVIGALCPYCMVVWTVTIPLFLYTLVYNVKEKHLSFGTFVNKIITKYHYLLLILMYGVIIITILVTYWYYWRTLIGV